MSCFDELNPNSSVTTSQRNVSETFKNFYESNSLSELVGESVFNKKRSDTHVYELLKNTQPDVYLITYGKHFKAHKEVILKNCTKLKSYIDGDKSVVKIRLESSLHAVAYLLVHMYLPPLNIDEDNIEEVAQVSNEVGCVSLLLKCKKFIKSFIDGLVNTNSKNLVKYINLCEKLHFVEFYNKLFEIFRKNFYKISKDVERLNTLNANTMRALIFDTELCIESELDLFHAIFFWITARRQEREVYIDEYFKAVCFERIDLSNLIEIESRFADLFKTYKSLNDLLYRGIKYHSLKHSSMKMIETKHRYQEFNLKSERLLKASCDSTTSDSFDKHKQPRATVNIIKQTDSREDRLKEFKVAVILIMDSRSSAILDDVKIKCTIDDALLALPEIRRKFVCIHCGDKVRIIGGNLNDSDDLFPEHDWDYDIKLGKLSKINRIPDGRTDFGVCTVSSEYIIVAGGKTSNDEVSNLIECCDIRSKECKWRCITSMTCACIAPAVKVNRKKIYVIGGLIMNDATKCLQISSQVFVFDMDSEKIEKRRNINTPLFNSFLTCYNNSLYLIGGLTAKNPNRILNSNQFVAVSKIEKYNECNDTWTKIFELNDMHRNSTFLLTSLIYPPN